MEEPKAEEGGQTSVASSVPNLPGSKGRSSSSSPMKQKAKLHSRKSTSMLHELQEYIKGVEAVASERKEALEKVFEEKRLQERKERIQRQNCRSHENDYANFANLMDMPTKLRALHEDLKAQKDKVRKYKEKALAGDRAILMQEKQIQRLRENLKAVTEALSSVGKNAKQVFDEQQLMEKVSEKEQEVQDLEHRLKIVMRSREVDQKKARNERAQERKTREALEEEIADLKLESEEKDKNIRMDAMKIKALTKQLEPLRRQLMKPGNRLIPHSHYMQQPEQPSNLFLTSVPDEEEAGASSQETLVVVDDRHIQVMICVVRDDMKIAGKTIVTKEEQEEAAAVKIQARIRGHQVRRKKKGPDGEEEGEEGDEEGLDRPQDEGAEGEEGAKGAEPEAEDQAALDAAATKIQAVQRGKAARKEVEKLRAAPQAESPPQAPTPEDPQPASSPAKEALKKESAPASPKKLAPGKGPAPSSKAKPAAPPAKGKPTSKKTK